MAQPTYSKEGREACRIGAKQMPIDTRAPLATSAVFVRTELSGRMRDLVRIPADCMTCNIPLTIAPILVRCRELSMLTGAGVRMGL
jgi:hypothetical protein